MTLLERLNQSDRFAASCGISLTYVAEGVARAVMTVGAEHINGAGTCQGGAIFTLADLAFAAVANSRGQLTVGVENTIIFHHAARLGDRLTAECHECFDHRRLPACNIEVRNQDGVLVASATGLAYRTSAEMPFDALM